MPFPLYDVLRGGCFCGDGGSVEGCEGLERLAASAGEGAALVGLGDAYSAFGDACNMHAPAELGASNACIAQANEKLDGDLERYPTTVRKD